MNDIIDIEIILKKQKYHPIYNIGTILIVIVLLFIYITFIYKYKTYYITKGTMINGNIKLLVDIDDIKYISNNNILTIDSNNYTYSIKQIDNNLYVDDSLNNYKYIYIKVNNLNNLDNYVYEIKFVKENKKIIEYLKEYI